MKFVYLALFMYVVTMVRSQLASPARNYNVTSPVPNGPYVIGQILPCTYRLFSDVDTLEIDLEAEPQVGGTNITTLPIATFADVSKTDAFIKREGNTTYYEHSINYSIPPTVKPGNYRVVMYEKSTNTRLFIPIEIRPAASSTSVGAKATNTHVAGRPQTPGSIFAQGNSSRLKMPGLWAVFVIIVDCLFFLLK